MPRSKDVDAWFKKSSHPLKKEMMKVRQIILAADRRMGECIKWQTPTFTFEGNLASFNQHTKAHVSLMFHTGAKIPGKHPRLLGGGNTARYMKLHTMAEVTKAKKDLEKLVKAWIALKSASATPKKTTKKKATKKKVAKKKTAKQKSKKKATKKKATKRKTKKTTKRKTATRKTKKKTTHRTAARKQSKRRR